MSAKLFIALMTRNIKHWQVSPSFCLRIFFSDIFMDICSSLSINQRVDFFNEYNFPSLNEISLTALDIVIIFVAVLLLCNFRANKKRSHLPNQNVSKARWGVGENAYLYWWKGMTQYVLLAHKNLLGIRVNRCCISNGT